MRKNYYSNALLEAVTPYSGLSKLRMKPKSANGKVVEWRKFEPFKKEGD